MESSGNISSITIRAKVVAKEIGLYTLFVIEDLDKELNHLYKYLTITQLPNWSVGLINLLDVGYFEYLPVIAGKTTWFNDETKQDEVYKYNGLYLLNYVKQDVENYTTKIFKM